MDPISNMIEAKDEKGTRDLVSSYFSVCNTTVLGGLRDLANFSVLFWTFTNHCKH